MSQITFFEKSLRDITTTLNAHKIGYMVIGGLAHAKWGNPRSTLDIDITIWVPDHEIANLIYLLEKNYSILVSDP